jgi:hypothetical protein
LLGYKLNAVAIIVNDLLKVGPKTVAPKVSEHSNIIKVYWVAAILSLGTRWSTAYTGRFTHEKGASGSKLPFGSRFGMDNVEKMFTLLPRIVLRSWGP